NRLVAEARGPLGARHDVDLDLRHLRDAEGRVIAEASLDDPSLLESDRAFQRVSQPPCDAALDLALDPERIDGDAAVRRGHDAVDANVSARPDRHLGHVREGGAAVIDVAGDSPPR